MTKLLSVVGTVGLLLAAPTAQATEIRDLISVSAHWAGYVARADSSVESVTGTWVQPRIVCNRPSTSAAFWVGLGGANADSTKLEQIGTSADCSAGARASYTAWYQLFPARAVEIPLSIRPGDSLTAAVAVAGNTVTLSLHNGSTGVTFSNAKFVRAPETDSAEWIVEAPAVCFATCTEMPLAQFERVRFTDAYATASGHSSTRSEPTWRWQRFELRTGSVWAIPHARSADDSAFAIVRSARRVFDAASGIDPPTSSTSWRVIGTGGDIGSGAVAAVAKHRTTRLAIRVGVTGQPKIAHVWTVILCNHGPFVRSRKDEFELRASAVSGLRPPLPYPENCGVTAYATTKAIVARSGNTIRLGTVRIEILAPRIE